MASFKQYTASGGASEAFSIPTFSSDEIKVYVNNVLKTAATHYNITSYTENGGTVTWTSGNVPSSGTVRIVRDTKILNNAGSDVEAVATYQAGSAIKQDDLNDNQKQVLRALLEKDDQLIQKYDIEAGAIGTDELKADAVTGAKIADDAIDSEHLAADSIDTEHYAPGSVDATALASNSVTSAKIVDGTITNADISASAAIDASKIVSATASVAGTISAANQAKLDGIEANATADQSDEEIQDIVGAMVTGNTESGITVTYQDSDGTIDFTVDSQTDQNFTNADHTKLDGIEASADVTDATNVNAAGAVMNSDLDVKGEILVGDGSGDPSALSVGTNDYVLTADSSAATGVAWKVAPASMTIQDEGSALSTTAQVLNFVGSGVVAAGTGTTKTITISGGGGGGGSVTTDFQYLELKAHNNASGAFSAGSASYELVTKGTNTVVSPTQAAALIINIAGVIQEPNTGTSIGSNDGFCIDGSSIHFGANLTAHPDYILYLKGAGEVSALADNSVTTAKIASSQVINSKIADDTIAEAKLDIHNAPSGTDKYLKYTSNGMEWATAGSGTPEGTAVLSTGESGTAKFLRVDGDGTCSWQVPPDTDTNTQLSTEQVQDIVGAMFTGNTETNIAATYEDSDGTIDLVSTDTVYTHPNHSGEVTSTADGATVIADNIVDEANLKVSNAPTNGYVLTAQSGNTGGLTWAAAASGTITALNNQAANRLTTIGSTTTQLDGEASLTFEDTTSTGLISGKQITGRGFECPATVADDWTIAAGNNAFFPGPMTVAAGKTVTVPANRTLTIV